MRDKYRRPIRPKADRVLDAKIQQIVYGSKITFMDKEPFITRKIGEWDSQIRVPEYSLSLNLAAHAIKDWSTFRLNFQYHYGEGIWQAFWMDWHTNEIYHEEAHESPAVAVCKLIVAVNEKVFGGKKSG